jgi:hypothetical protein
LEVLADSVILLDILSKVRLQWWIAIIANKGLLDNSMASLEAVNHEHHETTTQMYLLYSKWLLALLYLLSSRRISQLAVKSKASYKTYWRGATILVESKFVWTTDAWVECKGWQTLRRHPNNP